MQKRFLLTLLAGLLWAATASAADSAIKIDKAWARATMQPGATGVVYLTLSNSGPAAERLVGVSSPMLIRRRGAAWPWCAASAGVSQNRLRAAKSSSTRTKAIFEARRRP